MISLGVIKIKYGFPPQNSLQTTKVGMRRVGSLCRHAGRMPKDRNMGKRYQAYRYGPKRLLRSSWSDSGVGWVTKINNKGKRSLKRKALQLSILESFPKRLKSSLGMGHLGRKFSRLVFARVSALWSLWFIIFQCQCQYLLFPGIWDHDEFGHWNNSWFQASPCTNITFALEYFVKDSKMLSFPGHVEWN